MTPNLNIRPAIPDDLAPLTQLYNGFIRETPVTFDLAPYDPRERETWFAQFRRAGRHRLVVAAIDDRPVGYACSTRFRAKAAYDTSVETSIYLAPEVVGAGLGTRLYGRLFEDLAGEDVHRAYAGITLPNPASLALHRRFGFRALGVYREVGRKFGRYWDVAWFQKSLG